MADGFDQHIGESGQVVLIPFISFKHSVASGAAVGERRTDLASPTHRKCIHRLPQHLAVFAASSHEGGLLLVPAAWKLVTLEPSVVAPLRFMKRRPCAVVKEMLDGICFRLRLIQGHANSRSIIAVMADTDFRYLLILFADLRPPHEESALGALDWGHRIASGRRICDKPAVNDFAVNKPPGRKSTGEPSCIGYIGIHYNPSYWFWCDKRLCFRDAGGTWRKLLFH